MMRQKEEPFSQHDFDHWWRNNHPADWWASERGGKPLDTWTRVLVADLARLAYEAGRKSEKVIYGMRRKELWKKSIIIARYA